MYMPLPDPDKGVPMVAVEIMLQVIIMFLGILFIHRIIDFIPTISGVKYAPINIITVILPLLVILLNVNSASTIGQKVGLLWETITGGPKEKPAVKSTQPGFNPPQFLPQGGHTSNPMASAPPAIREPDFNSMFTPSNQPQDFEPIAANSGGVLF